MITINEIRKKAKMTQKEFYELTGIPIRTLQDWEYGRRTAPEYLIKMIYLYIMNEKPCSDFSHEAFKKSLDTIEKSAIYNKNLSDQRQDFKEAAKWIEIEDLLHKVSEIAEFDIYK